MSATRHVFLEDEDAPEWFALDFDLGRPGEPPRVLIGIEREFLGGVAITLLFDSAKPLSLRLKQDDFSHDFVLPSGPSGGGSWGFGNVLVPCASPSPTFENDRLAWYAITAPRVEFEQDDPCDQCEGSGKRDGDDCLYCQGFGRETEQNWERICQVGCTLAVLTPLLKHPLRDWLPTASSGRRQLLELEAGYSTEYSHISATLSREFADYLRRNPQQEVPRAIEAMWSTYITAFPRYARFGKGSFRARIHQYGQLILDAPQASLGADGMQEGLKRGYSGSLRLTDHHVDSPVQMFALLAGLAGIAGIVRREIALLV